MSAVMERSRAAETAVSDTAGLLRDVLPWLDRLIQGAIAAAATVYGPMASENAFRGLHIGQDELAHLLAREPGRPLLGSGDGDPEAALQTVLERTPRLRRLAATFGLSLHDVGVIVVALGPELDLRYERLYAYLQDDVTRRRPSVDLALNLLCPTAEAKITRRAHFAADGPLIRHGLVQLVADPAQLRPPLLAHYLKLDEQIVRGLVVGDGAIDPRLARFCSIASAVPVNADGPLDPAATRGLVALATRPEPTASPRVFYLQGAGRATATWAAEMIAARVGVPVLVADVARMVDPKLDFEEALKLLLRDAALRGAVVCLYDLDVVRTDERPPLYLSLLDALAQHQGVVLLAGAQPWAPALWPGEPDGALTVPWPVADHGRRRVWWQARLSAAGIAAEAGDLDVLADRFRLTPDQIGEAVTAATEHALWCSAGRSDGDPALPLAAAQPTTADLFAAVRASLGRGLGPLTQQIAPRHTWDDIVLPADQMTQLREVCHQVRYRHRVYGAWGFERKLSLGKGLNVLFVGPPGTGKTMAAEVIASDLQRDLYRIDLSQVMSKYIGETEKNLHAIFRDAEAGAALLFFDEADALFGKRAEVRDAHDRYANIETGYLLQKMEAHEGAVILATNLRNNMDGAFVRRMHFVVEFPFPDEEHRRRIWSAILPDELPVDLGVDLGFMARQFKVAGGHIRNIVLAAAFLAAADDRPLAMVHLVRATRREYRKLGWVCSEADFGPYYGLVSSADA